MLHCVSRESLQLAAAPPVCGAGYGAPAPYGASAYYPPFGSGPLSAFTAYNQPPPNINAAILSTLGAAYNGQAAPGYNTARTSSAATQLPSLMAVPPPNQGYAAVPPAKRCTSSVDFTSYNGYASNSKDKSTKVNS